MNKNNIVGAALTSLAAALLLVSVIVGIGVLFDALPPFALAVVFLAATASLAVGRTISLVSAIRDDGRGR